MCVVAVRFINIECVCTNLLLYLTLEFCEQLEIFKVPKRIFRRTGFPPPLFLFRLNVFKNYIMCTLGGFPGITPLYFFNMFNCLYKSVLSEIGFRFIKYLSDLFVKVEKKRFHQNQFIIAKLS